MKIHIPIIASLLLLTAAPALFPQECASKLTSDQLSRKIESLIAQMTPQERIAQLQDRAPAIPRLHIPAYNWWNEGLHGIARNGFATVFPQAIGLAATFDSELLQQVGDTVSTEARAKFNPHADADSPRYAGLTIWSPNINIFRDPRWGRGQETYGEDPFLTGELGGRFVQGIQGSNPSYRKADATPKHFAVHSGPESIRDGFNSVTSAHDLADTYLPAFEKLTGSADGQAHADAMMCSYNAINGVPACANPRLLQNGLRDGWGFQGYVVSDCDAIDEVTEYLHYTTDHAHGAAASLKAGVDLNCGTTYNYLNESLQKGLIVTSDIDRALYRLLLARFRLGLLQPASCSPYSDIPASAVDTPRDRSLALRAAQESVVLLRNDRLSNGTPLLPLDLHGMRVAVIGPSAALLSVIEANYHGTPRHPETLLDGLRSVLLKGTEISYAQGSTLVKGVTVPIPASAFASGSLQGKYFANSDFQGNPALLRQDSWIDFDFDHVSPLNDEVAGQAETAYSVRWTGALVPPGPGPYRLRVKIDRCFDCKGHDAFRLWIDDQLALDNDGRTDKSPDASEFHWTDNRPHPIRLELRHTGEDQGIHLEWEAPAEIQLAESLAVAAKSDIILALVGLSPDLEGEALQIKIPGFNGGDREDLRLPEAQRNLLLALAKLHKPIVIGITSGSPVATADVLSRIQTPTALLQLWYPGESGGRALAHLLAGDSSPSGRLPVTIYRAAQDLPSFTDYSMAHRTYRYFKGSVEFPFGFGLSYSTFRYTQSHVEHSTLTAGESLSVRATVTNTGSYAADEVAQLYLIPPASPANPGWTLQGFQRIHLLPGESRTLQFVLNPRQLSLVDSQGMRAVRSGSYRIFVGGSQPPMPALDTSSAGFTIQGSFAIRDRDLGWKENPSIPEL